MDEVQHRMRMVHIKVLPPLHQPQNPATLLTKTVSGANLTIQVEVFRLEYLGPMGLQDTQGDSSFEAGEALRLHLIADAEDHREVDSEEEDAAGSHSLWFHKTLVQYPTSGTLYAHHCILVCCYHTAAYRNAFESLVPILGFLLKDSAAPRN